jgi:hypothetical protein
VKVQPDFTGNLRAPSFGTQRLRAFKADEMSPLTWWRTLPSDAFDKAARLSLRMTLEKIEMLHADDDFKAALKGDPGAAIGVAFSLMPIAKMTLHVDIAMTALLLSALENAAAALVLAQLVGLTDLGHPHAIELASSWLACGRHSSEDPCKFRDAEAVLLAAFQERDPEGDHE